MNNLSKFPIPIADQPMDYLGQYYGIATHYFDLQKEHLTSLPEKNWYCCAIANNDFETGQDSQIDKFIRRSIDNGILAWHGLGRFGEKLHDTFDWIMVTLEVEENHMEIDVSTAGSNENEISNSFWGCYGAACLPESTDYDSIILVCVSFDGNNYKKELTDYINKFNNGWLPPD